MFVEVHDEVELERALQSDAKLIGVNNRDLRTFKVDLKQTAEIAALFPFDEERVLISESGIWETEDALFVAESVPVQFLSANHLCEAVMLATAYPILASITGGSPMTKVKICGLMETATCENSSRCRSRCNWLCLCSK